MSLGIEVSFERFQQRLNQQECSSPWRFQMKHVSFEMTLEINHRK